MPNGCNQVWDYFTFLQFSFRFLLKLLKSQAWTCVGYC